MVSLEKDLLEKDWQERPTGTTHGCPPSHVHLPLGFGTACVPSYQLTSCGRIAVVPTHKEIFISPFMFFLLLHPLLPAQEAAHDLAFCISLALVPLDSAGGDKVPKTLPALGFSAPESVTCSLFRYYFISVCFKILLARYPL